MWQVYPWEAFWDGAEGLGFQALGWALAQLPFSGPPGIHELLFLFVARR